MTESPQLEERQMEEPKDESESERERRRQEWKRKGKLLAQLARKKVKTASPTVTIQELGQLSIGRNRRLLEDKDEEENSKEERQREWERRNKQREERVLPSYTKFFVNMDRNVLQRVTRFDDPKVQEECEARLAGGKTTKSGKQLHQPSLQDLGAEEEFVEYITGIGFEWLLETGIPDVP